MVATERRKWLALALLSAVQFIVVLDIAIVNVALPSIKIDLGFSQENLQWVISAYALFFGGFLLLGGRAADLLGRRRLFLAGIVLFTLSSLLAGLAWSEGSLIAARSFQGLGAAVISPAALSILSTTFTEGRERNIALGVWGAVGGFGAAAGVLLGGVLTEALSWSWIFFVNVPVGVVGFLLAPRLLNESRDASVKTFDFPGAVLVTGGLVSLSIAALAGVHPTEAGLASGLFNTTQQIGGALGIAALSTIATSHTTSALKAGTALPSALIDGFTAAFVVGVGVAAVGVLAALTLIRRDELAPVVQEAQPALDLAA